eukprot:TRINITY_DN539_c1_g3_i2.p1 TRINITY_DN539_c1_g3~~TRINITY_DN539_c1_g3_i2.p1  ORF type:complete len:349 (+),score=29.15 TRINITY_DN539_c1_g3_i2:610-1656(+)
MNLLQCLVLSILFACQSAQLVRVQNNYQEKFVDSETCTDSENIDIIGVNGYLQKYEAPKKYIQKYDVLKAQEVVGRIFKQGWNLEWNNLCKSYQDETDEISLDNIFHFLSIDFERVNLVSIYTLIIASGICFPLVQNYFSNKVSRKDRKFSEDEKLIMTIHTIFSSLFCIQLIPYMFVSALFLFGNPMLVLLKYRYLFLGIVISHSLMYSWELIFRSVIKFHSFIMVHHIVYVFYMVMVFFKPSIFVLQHGVILDWMNTFHFVLYASNVFFKVFRGVRPVLVQRIIMCGMILVAVTRIFQTVMLVKHLTCTDANKDVSYWIMTATTSFLTLLQTYTWFPYTYMYKNCN